MDYQSYEDYMRQVLGYSPYNPNIYENYNYEANENNTYYRNESTFNLTEEDVSQFYPEVYHLVNPLICKVCDTVREPITKELLEKMTDEVYYAIDPSDTVVNVRVETKRDDLASARRQELRTERTPKRPEETKEVRAVSERRNNNFNLRDLIKILILKQLISGGNRPPVRPPRPPYPGGPGMMPRPPYPRNI